MPTRSGIEDLGPDDLRGAVVSGWARYGREEGDLVVVTLERPNASELELRFTGVAGFSDSAPALTAVRAFEATPAASGLWQFTLVGERDGERMQLVAREVRLFE
jgi:hypothetical protein